MAKHVDRSAGVALVETGVLAQFQVTSTHVEPSPDGETSFVRIEMQLGGGNDDHGDDDDRDDGDGEDEVEWAAFGFMFVLALLSFNDARATRLLGSGVRGGGRAHRRRLHRGTTLRAWRVAP